MFSLLVAALSSLPIHLVAVANAGEEHVSVQGVTISCQTWGWEWGSDGIEAELDDLRSLGVNWIAIHPYARIQADGGVSWRAFDAEAPPAWLRRPIEAAHARGMAILIKPHLAYWGSPFGWRGEITFEGEERERFFREYERWIVELARVTGDADAFAVGTELDRLIDDPAPWKRIVGRVRKVSSARLTYAANWTDYLRVPFWDALDAVGVQAYFPLTEDAEPDAAAIAAGWAPHLAALRALSERVGKPVVFTELGYNTSLAAAREPWAHPTTKGAQRERASRLQASCMAVALEVLEREQDWLRGAFLWKWFVGEPGWNDANFLVDAPPIRNVLERFWK